MKAIIMAGGEGSRLRPLTCTAPKPMLRLLDRPLMEYALLLLLRHGIDRIAATLGYLPDAVTDYFGDGQDFGVELHYYTERSPLGTAGGVRQARDFLDEPFAVLSGDGITDLDLSAAWEFHRSRRALATLVLKRVAEPLEYGVVVTDADGRVRGFYEKPEWRDVLSDTVNTGIYICAPELLERIPADRPCDFGQELFPALVRAGEAVYGYVAEAYWGDVGDTRAYLQTHLDALNGEIQLEPLLACAGKVTVAPGAQVDRSAVLEAPCYIGSEARVYGGARIGPGSAIGAGAVVRNGATVKRGVVLPGAELGAGAALRGGVVGPGAALGEDARAFEGSVLAAGAHLGARAELRPGVMVWPEKRVPEGEIRAANLVWGGGARETFPAYGLPLHSPDHAVRAAEAWAAALRPGEALLARASSAAAQALWHACAAGLAAQGVRVIDAGIAPLPQLRRMQAEARLNAAALVEEGALLPLNAHGAPLSRRELRRARALLARQDYAPPFAGEIPPVRRYGCGDLGYVGAAAALFTGDPLKAPAIAVYAPDNALLSLAERALRRAGLRVRAEWEEALMLLDADELGLWLSPRGELTAMGMAPERGMLEPEALDASSFAQAEGEPDFSAAVPPLKEADRLDEAELQLLRAWVALEAGEKRLVEQASATRALDDLAERYGAAVEYTVQERALWLDRLATAAPVQFLVQTDGIALALLFAAQLARKGIGLRDWQAAMPRTHRLSRSVPVPPRSGGRILQALAGERGAELGGGVRIPRERGWAWVCPDDSGERCQLVAEGMDAETARELCDFYEDRLRALAEGERPHA